MTGSDGQFDRVWALIAAEPESRDDKPDVVGWMQRLCRAASAALPSTGVGVSVMDSEGRPATVAASDPHSATLEDLQFTVGEGPCIDAYRTGRPVMAPDLSVAARVRWPGYAAAAQEHGIQAVFAVPLQIGAARLGALDIYNDRPGSLSPETIAQALTFADAAMTGLLNAQQRSNEDGCAPALDDALDNRFELYQAQGMVAVQLGIRLHEAMIRIRAYAFAHGRALSDVADDIIARKIVLETDS
ncbi:GAF and ANTAR domain-containing protein [Nocardioides mesophilus]|uniref:GAF and ANTAR domain-containing protein n=1 Tax=Nocardioides mesophilus TaxID=433659 RepID=UPI001CB6E10F|nr:GAF and ANTAR domain-containing protein [Nocardioides mesophilus]